MVRQFKRAAAKGRQWQDNREHHNIANAMAIEAVLALHPEVVETFLERYNNVRWALEKENHNEFTEGVNRV